MKSGLHVVRSGTEVFVCFPRRWILLIFESTGTRV